MKLATASTLTHGHPCIICVPNARTACIFASFDYLDTNHSVPWAYVYGPDVSRFFEPGSAPCPTASARFPLNWVMPLGDPIPA